MKNLLVLGVSVIILVTCAETIWAFQHRDKKKKSAKGWEVERQSTIPKSYRTYSLFLVCNPKWLEQRQGDKSSDQLHDLYYQFKNFGRTIGDSNAAVWFWIHRDISTNAENVDVERSVRFCQAWHLKPSAGPHIVVTSTYPDESDLSLGLPPNSAVFELGNMESAQISELLAKLTDELLGKGQVETASEAPEAGWVRLLAAVQQIINKVGCAWSFKIDAGPVKADLHSCKS